MKKSELQRILQQYVVLICREQRLCTTSYDKMQWKILTKNVEQFSSLCKENYLSTSFFYEWYNNNREIFDQEALWEIAFKNDISREQFDKMFQSWSSLEHNIIRFTKENQKLLEKSKNKQQNKDQEHER
ncbi:MAG: hypothetical protein QM564_06680 [Bergeyella sp.]